MRDLKSVSINEKEQLFLDGEEITNVTAYKLENSADTQILGTTGFAAPEQYGLSQSDVRTDIYALGVLINVMLTGEHPSRNLAKGRMGRIVDRCTHVNPQRRYKNVLRLMEAL